MAAIAEQEKRAFARSMHGHLRGFAPHHAKAMGDAALERTIDLGISRAEGYGLTYRGPVQLYLELMILFGSAFDTDPMIPWAGRILADGGPEDQMARAELLHGRARGFFDSVFGPEYAYERAAIERLTAAHFEELPDSPEFVKMAIARAREVYPEKVMVVGEGPLCELITRAGDAAAKVGLKTRQGVAVVAGMMFALGHGCLEDPQFPWIARAVGRLDADEPRRVRRLVDLLLRFLKSGAAEAEA